MGTPVAPLPRRSSRRWIGPAMGAAALVLVAVVVVSRVGGGDDADTGGPAATALAVRTVEAGPVTVKIEPRQFDAAGAAFKVTFDTHSEGLDLDVARGATLLVGGAAWPVAGWTGAGPGGHHREGELRFSAGGPAAGTATLTITGLSRPATATWDVEG